jgi:ATP-dependent DNA ligase
MSNYIKENIDAQAVILDGEMVVWDTENNRAAPFGMNK